MKMTAENVTKIQIGDQILIRHREGCYDEGIVYANDELGIKCNRSDGHSYFCFGPSTYDGEMDIFVINSVAVISRNCDVKDHCYNENDMIEEKK